MSWVSKDGEVWLNKRCPSRSFPHVFNFVDLKVVVKREIRTDLKVLLERCGARTTLLEDGGERLGKEVADVVDKANKDFLDDLDEEDEGLENDGEEAEEEDDWRPEGAAKPRIIKRGSMVFGKIPKGQTKRGRPRSYDTSGPAVEPRGELSDYEKLRQKNMKEREMMFREILEMAKELKPKVIRPSPRPRQIRRSMPYSTRTEPIKLRSRHVTGTSDSDSGISSGWSTPTKRFREEDETDDGDYLPARKRRSCPTRWAKDPNVNVPTPDDITDEMLDNVCDYVSEKVYNPANGTSCHQCRQKTLDTKTICRSGFCHGVRGAFCGVCLKNRYGQDAREALKDPNWQCPVCLDKCNCSICRNRKGKAATGILTGLALSKGYNSVADYLDHLISKKGGDQFDEE